MEQIYRILIGPSGGFMDVLDEPCINKSLKQLGVTIMYDRMGDRKIFLFASVNREFSRATIKTGVCIESDMDEVRKALKDAYKIRGYVTADMYSNSK